ncbi:MAG TPA: VOC family protein [Thermoanaerobaculia bacterium]|nr:VOC family protein [Thermoanaerobaculia bacterium]
MAGKVKPIPDGYNAVTPYLIVDGAAAAIEFYKKTFGAKEVMRMPAPGGRIGHAEVTIGDSHVMLADENPDMNARSPKSVGGSPISLLLYVDDVDKTVERAIAAGAKLKRPVADQFYGDRTGGIEDPFGHQWYVATHIEDVSPEEMQKRSRELAAAAK